jgi:cytochrome c556
VNERTAQRWFKRFASGNLSSENEQRPGRPRIWDSEATKEAAEQQPTTSMLRLSDTLGPSKSTIHRHLTALGNICKSGRILHHEQSAEQAQDESNFVVNYFSCRKNIVFLKES